MPDQTPPPSSDHGKAAAALGTGRRNTAPSLAAEKWIDVFKTLAWVAPLTILVWIYAEREQTATQANVQFPVEVRVNDPNRIVTLLDPLDHKVTATALTGPKTVLDRFINDTLLGNADHAAVQIFIDPHLPKGVQSYQTSQLTNNPVFTRLGISVKDVTPRTLRFEVDDLETQTLRVKAPDDLPATIVDARFSPSMVRVTAPSRWFARAEQENKLYLVAELSRIAAQKPPGPYEIAGVTLALPLPQHDFVTLEARSVQANFEIKQQDDKTVLPSMPIWVVAPPKFLDDYTVTLSSPTISDIPIAGPADKIGMLTRGDVRAGALLFVGRDDLIGGEGQELKKLLRFDDLPPGVRVTGDTAHYEITIKIVARPK